MSIDVPVLAILIYYSTGEMVRTMVDNTLQRISNLIDLVFVRATAVGRGAERDAERNAVLAGDPKCLVYYVMID